MGADFCILWIHGGIAERFIAADLKSAVPRPYVGTVGSNPTPTANNIFFEGRDVLNPPSATQAFAIVKI